MGVRKFAVATALATAVALALGGCALSGSIVDKARLDMELTQLTSTLKELPAVGDATSTLELHADYSYTVTMRVLSSSPSEADAIAIVHAVDAAFSTGALSTQPRSFALETENGHLIGHYVFGLDEARIAADMHYFYALSEAYGAPTTMGIGGPDNGQPGEYQRSIAASAQGTGADWEAMRAIPDPSPSVSNTWEFLGLATTGSLPSDDVVDVLEQLAHVLPAGSEGNAWMSWDGDKFSIQVSPSENQTGPFADMPLWPKVTATAGVLAESELPATLIFSASSMSNLGSGTVHIRECAFDTGPAERDAEFVEALEASGVVLPEGSGAGWC